MKELPILANSEEVRAYLDGSKTQTRIPVKHQDKPIRLKDCPWQIRDRLYVRETFSFDHKDFYPHYPVVYKADGYPEDFTIENGRIYSPEQKQFYPFRWRPNIHMPKRTARIWLEITAVRVERVQNIIHKDLRAEGVEGIPGGPGVQDYHYKASFTKLWESLYPGSWERNDWVWVREFKRIDNAPSN